MRLTRQAKSDAQGNRHLDKEPNDLSKLTLRSHRRTYRDIAGDSTAKIPKGIQAEGKPTRKEGHRRLDLDSFCHLGRTKDSRCGERLGRSADPKIWELIDDHLPDDPLLLWQCPSTNQAG